MRLSMKALALTLPIVLAISVAAQMPPDAFVFGGGPAGVPLQARAAMRIESGDAPPVKGAPFCATVSTEHTQMFADGNRIHTTEASLLCRDSEGRTRREASLNLLGAAVQTSAPKLVTIVDPVAHIRYLLDTASKTARKTALDANAPTAADAHSKGEDIMIAQHAGPGGDVFFNKVFINKGTEDSPESAPDSENLGDQTINGIHATGTRVSHTIPAGKMGNEKPITVTTERWYSPELKVTVMTKHDDPWAGTLKIELKGVSSAEPDASLFTVPPDYKIEENNEAPMMINLPPPAPGAQ
jgi:hypothetical protein